MKLKAVSGIMLALLLLSMLTLAFNSQPVKADPKTIYVDDDNTAGPWDGTPAHPYRNITSALQHASINDTIYVYNGTYYENVVMNKTVSLIGENKETTIIDGNGTGDVVYITADNVTISGFTIQNGEEGIHVLQSDGNTISGNIISNNLVAHANGIRMNSSDYNIIRNNEISNNNGGFVMLEGCHKNIINGNNVTNNEVHGILPSQGSNCNTIVNNTVTSNKYGITPALGANNNTIINNTISSNTKEGICVVNCWYNEIIGNYITNNSDGIELAIISRYQIIKDNIISKNHCGINITNSDANIIYHNNFINNTQQVYDVSWERPSVPPSINIWDDGYPSGGNYWSDYIGVDVKSGPNQDQPSSDGIGDTAYVIDDDDRDNYPLMYPWGAPSPPSYTLTIYSSPSGVTFTVDGVSRTTPWSGTYSEGSSVSLVMPETHNVLVNYVWSHWLEDGDTDRIKTVTVDADITLTAVYKRQRPVGGKATPINIPTNKPETSALWIWLLTIILPLVATVVFMKLKKKKH